MMNFTKNSLHPTNHYFVHWLKNSKSLRFGKYGLSQSALLPDIYYQDFQEFASEFSKNESDSHSILVYIHGFMADVEFFEQKAGFILQNEIFNPISSHYPTVISLKWQTTFDYRESIHTAEETGAVFYDVIKSLQLHLNPVGLGPVWSFLCHSMGNRILSGWLKSDRLSDHRMKYGTLCLMAADMPSHVFINEWSFLTESADKIVVFINAKDKTLDVANWMVEYPRLGKTGPSEIHPRVLVIDATSVRDHEGLVPKISKHRYYYASALIRDMLRKIYNGEKSVSLNGTTYVLPEPLR